LIRIGIGFVRRQALRMVRAEGMRRAKLPSRRRARCRFRCFGCSRLHGSPHTPSRRLRRADEIAMCGWSVGSNGRLRPSPPLPHGSGLKSQRRCRMPEKQFWNCRAVAAFEAPVRVDTQDGLISEDYCKTHSFAL